ncbi:hypothetical protein [Leucobacter ruminantium]|uniref:Uncharacterized protein n=1 Tax=Leucobacter ruminantium TaxID=1289170 RepID=A0A939LYB5_9MICO|nr:hypothetical protein [Leucobacter ruminantium]MBO1804647.1 hypothetical protein [Leucobacter ruminantium]
MTEGPPLERVRLARALFPDLAAELDGALARHGGDDTASFDDWLDGAATEMLGGIGFDEVADPAISARFEAAFAAARAAADRLGAPLPEPEAFTAAGVPFERLASAMAADPELLPVPAPHGLGSERWRRAFAHGDVDGLVLATEALREFDALDALDATPTGEAAPPAVEAPGGVRWTLRLVPAGHRPARLGLGFSHGPHPTLPEMLMLQLMRVMSGEPPVDAESFTWLSGSLADGRLAARHVYDASDGVVRISCREVGSQGPHLGARPPVG